MDQPNNPTVSNSNQPPKKNHHIILLAVLVLIAVVELFLLLSKNGKLPTAVTTEESQVTEESLTEGTVEGVFSLNSQSTTVSVGTPIVFTVTADSNKRGVVGFDAVVEYDTSAFSLASVSSSLQGFTAVGSTRKKYLEVTSAKDPQTLVTPVLSNTEVLKITLNPLKQGSYAVKLLDKVDSSTTKFVDSETEVFRPQTNSVTVTVE